MACDWLRRVIFFFISLGFVGVVAALGQDGLSREFERQPRAIYGTPGEAGKLSAADGEASGSQGFSQQGSRAQGLEGGFGVGIRLAGYGLAILVVLGAGALVLFRGGLWSGLGSGGRLVRKLQIEETRMLGHRQYLVVAHYEGRRMLLGVCPGRIDYLCPLDWEVEMGSRGSRFPEVGEEGGA